MMYPSCSLCVESQMSPLPSVLFYALILSTVLFLTPHSFTFERFEKGDEKLKRYLQHFSSHAWIPRAWQLRKYRAQQQNTSKTMQAPQSHYDLATISAKLDGHLGLPRPNVMPNVRWQAPVPGNVNLPPSQLDAALE